MAKVSVVVSTYTKNRINDIVKCLNSLKNQSLKPYEVILVLEPDPELIEFYKKNLEEFNNFCKIVSSKGRGLSEARNTGAELARGEFIAFIDDDAWAEKNWLKNLIKPFKNERVWGVGGKIVPKFEGVRPKWLAEELDWIVGCTYKGMSKEIRNPIGANMCFRKEAFKFAKFSSSIGRYGKKLLSGEETEFSMKLKRLNPDIKYIYAEDAVVFHRVPRERCSIKYAIRRSYYEGYSKAILSQNYPLSKEKEYLAYIIKQLGKKIVDLKFAEFFGMLVCIFFVFLGTLAGKINVLFSIPQSKKDDN